MLIKPVVKEQALEKLGEEISFQNEEYKEYNIILNDLDVIS